MINDWNRISLDMCSRDEIHPSKIGSIYGEGGGDTLSNRLEEIVERITGGGSRTPVAMLHRRPY